MGRLDGRVAWITGGGRGIGRAIALEMAREGADIAISSRTESELEGVAGEIEGLGCRALAVRADVMGLEDIRNATREILSHFGRLDILVNNAGGGVPPRKPEDLQPFPHDDQSFLDNLNLNLISVWRATREVLPHMRDQGYGRIINIGSGYAKHSGGTVVYTAAKHGVVGLTRALAALVASHGITVNCLCPGWTNTRLVNFDAMGKAMGVDGATARTMVENDNLQKRILEPEELGPMAALLASEVSAGITGQVISVDGGYKV
jgi:NAD(P)-dependent dehydrogenase (short-subunit alcohol dehydrogenase family)